MQDDSDMVLTHRNNIDWIDVNELYSGVYSRLFSKIKSNSSRETQNDFKTLPFNFPNAIYQQLAPPGLFSWKHHCSRNCIESSSFNESSFLLRFSKTVPKWIAFVISLSLLRLALFQCFLYHEPIQSLVWFLVSDSVGVLRIYTMYVVQCTWRQEVSNYKGYEAFYGPLRPVASSQGHIT